MARRINKVRIRFPRRRVNKTYVHLWGGEATPPGIERRSITLAFEKGPRDVDAHVFGPLGVHRNLADGMSPSWWIVTHIRTGMTIIGASARASFKQASKIARLLTVPVADGGPDWNFGSFAVAPPSDDPRLDEVRRLYLSAGIKAGLTLKRSADCPTGRINKRRLGSTAGERSN